VESTYPEKLAGEIIMRRLIAVCIAALALILFVSTGTAVAGPVYVVQTVQHPADPTFTQLLGINNAGTIAGFHGAVTAQGFTLVLPNTFTAQNFPASATSMVTAINSAGSTAGIYVDSGGTTHGYTDMGGVFTTVDQPGTLFNQALGINDGNTTVGYSSATDPAGMTGQTAYSQSGDVFTNILLPANDNSQAVGINNADNTVGFYMPTPTTSIGFLDIGGTISTIDPFGSTFTQALGISNTGEIVGFYIDAFGAQHGYVDIGGVFTSFDPVTSVSTTINGLNDLGQFVGFFTDANDNVIGFVATPTTAPEPATLALLGIGLAGIGFSRRKQ
jgi:hypothetical protein